MDENSQALSNYSKILGAIADSAKQASRLPQAIALTAVSKTKSAEEIEPLLAHGHRIFGENRVQEAQAKWPSLKDKYAGVELHLIGPLQSNKAADAVALFDVIETVDRQKIAEAVAREMAKQNRALACYVQVNTGLEPQKAGIEPEQTADFVAYCKNDLGLNIIGLMCIPPADENPGPHFALLRKLAEQSGLTHLSMGMSGDYEIAIAFGATSVRVGSSIFGARSY